MRMMQRMGMNMKEIKAKRVIIETDTGRIIITNPSVSKISAQGKATYQISGNEETENFNEEDITIIVDKTKVSEDKARNALKKSNGDIAEAIMMLGTENENSN